MITFSVLSVGFNFTPVEFNFDFLTIILDDVEYEDDIKNYDIDELVESYSALSVSISDILYLEIMGLQLINYKFR